MTSNSKLITQKINKTEKDKKLVSQNNEKEMQTKINPF